MPACIPTFIPSWANTDTNAESSTRTLSRESTKPAIFEVKGFNWKFQENSVKLPAEGDLFPKAKCPM